MRRLSVALTAAVALCSVTAYAQDASDQAVANPQVTATDATDQQQPGQLGVDSAQTNAQATQQSSAQNGSSTQSVQTGGASTGSNQQPAEQQKNAPVISADPNQGVQKDETKATSSSNVIAPEPKKDEPPTTVSSDKMGELRAGDVSAAIKLNARISGQVDSAFPIDTRGTSIAPTPVDTRFRIAPEIHFRGFGAVAEADVYSGLYGGVPAEDAIGLGAVPYAAQKPADFRQLFLEYKGETWVARVGEQTSQWGLGLVANGGNQDAPAGEFGDAHFGDLTYRALLAGRPLFGLGGAWRAIEPAVAFDVINRDDTANYANGDRALQGILALRFAVDQNKNFGIYSVYRHQRAVGSDPNLRSTDAFVVDVAGKWEWERWDVYRSVGLEAAYITGTTTQGRNELFPQHDVQQFGAAVKSSLRLRNIQGYLDLGYASGDQNPYDQKIQNFKFDPDYHVGFILFDQVLALQSARTAARASDPNLVGVPQDGVDLLPTRGSVTGATYAYPRVRYGAREWLDIYGGPLFAWTTARWVDPYAARIDGGSAVNTLGGRAGSFLGTELDLGLQARWHPREGITLSATGEFGTFVPGSAFTTSSGDVMAPVTSGRLRLAAQL